MLCSLSDVFSMYYYLYTCFFFLPFYICTCFPSLFLYLAWRGHRHNNHSITATTLIIRSVTLLFIDHVTIYRLNVPLIVSHSPLLSSSGTVGQASPSSLPGVPSHDSNTTRGYHGNPSPAHPLMGSQSGNVQLQTPPTVHPQLGIPPRAATPHGPLPQQVLVTNYLNQVQQSSNNYPPSIGGVAHYQTMQLPPTAGNTAGGISHIRMATPIGSHYPPGMNPESASSNYQGYPLVGGGVMPTRGGTIPSSTLPPASVHRLPQHSNIANWKK